jgi:Mg2+-importing ATPase
MTTLLIMFIGSMIPYTPFASALGMVPLPALFWPFCIGYLVIYSFLTHGVKTWFNRRFQSGDFKGVQQ